jgi:Fuc2NAc and GlcNAc transferase
LLIQIIILTSGILSLTLTDFIRKFALKRSLTDNPNFRSLHTEPIPRLGGIAILLTWFPALVLLFLNHAIEKSLFFSLLCGIPVAIVSILDDIRSINPIIRLVVHIISSLLAFYFLGFLRSFITIDIGFDYSILLYAIAVVGMVWFINLFNFMDGIDGFAAVEAIFIAFVLYFFSGNLICLLLIACVIGFLFWNWPKAEIFLGDAGSTQLGFILIVLGIYFHNSFQLSILNWTMIAAPFWFDATFTLFRRWRNKENLGKAHKKHAYQRIVQFGFSHRRTLFVLVIINTMIFVMILLYREINMLKFPLTILTLAGLYLIYRMVDVRTPFDTIP